MPPEFIATAALVAVVPAGINLELVADRRATAPISARVRLPPDSQAVAELPWPSSAVTGEECVPVASVSTWVCGPTAGSIVSDTRIGGRAEGRCHRRWSKYRHSCRPCRWSDPKRGT